MSFKTALSLLSYVSLGLPSGFFQSRFHIKLLILLPFFSRVRLVYAASSALVSDPTIFGED
jgi:hypothetical protein